MWNSKIQKPVKKLSINIHQAAESYVLTVTTHKTRYNKHILDLSAAMLFSRLSNYMLQRTRTCYSSQVCMSLSSTARHVLSIDQGTSSTRAMIFSDQSEVASSHQVEHQQYFPSPGYVEHDVEEIWKNTELCIKVCYLNDHCLYLLKQIFTPLHFALHFTPFDVSRMQCLKVTLQPRISVLLE